MKAKKGIILLLILGCTPMIHAASPIYGVVLAGGVGERLWPLSRQAHPKQFLHLGASTLIEQSLVRLEGITDYRCVVTAQSQEKQVYEVAGPLLDDIIVEPVGRNTGPAILYTCLQLYEKNPDAVVLFVPADPFIPEVDYDLFKTYVRDALSFAQTHNQIVLLGVKPTFPATGYGYIEYGDKKVDALCKVMRFHEKPSLKIAQSYYQQPHMLWNIGMFCAKVSLFIDEYKRVAPELFAQVQAFRDGTCEYKDIESISVDCAVIEKSNHVWVHPVDFSWCDVGNLEIFCSLKERYTAVSKPIEINAHNNLVDVPGKLVALVGVDDLCIVETDDALLITKKEQAENVRAVVSYLKQNDLKNYL